PSARPSSNRDSRSCRQRETAHLDGRDTVEARSLGEANLEPTVGEASLGRVNVEPSQPKAPREVQLPGGCRREAARQPWAPPRAATVSFDLESVGTHGDPQLVVAYLRNLRRYRKVLASFGDFDERSCSRRGGQQAELTRSDEGKAAVLEGHGEHRIPGSWATSAQLRQNMRTSSCSTRPKLRLPSYFFKGLAAFVFVTYFTHTNTTFGSRSRGSRTTRAGPAFP